MNKARSLLTLFIFVVSLLLAPDTNRAAYAQQTPINETVAAVVRILGCNVAGCNQGLGSGVLIHPSGVVLTANHVTLSDLDDPTSQLEDFLIEMTTSAQLPPQPRYRARLVAFKPESDLALLRIYWDEIANQPIDVTTLPDLPTLPLPAAETIVLGEQVHILGYPIAGGRAINYAQLVVGGFDEGGALLKVSSTLSEGNSGGPALVERNGRFEIAGIVLRRRGTLGEIGFIRRIDQLQEMTWLVNAQRVWVDNVQVSTQSTGATASLQISAQIHALDMVNRHIYLLAYAFEANSYRPWRPSPTGLPKSATGQVVFSQEFVAQHVVETAQTITFAQHSLGVDPQQLLFRLLLWDSEATQVLWQDVEWRHPQSVTAVALAPPTQTATPTTSALPALRPPTPAETLAPPAATHTVTPEPDLMATATAIAQMVATSLAATQAALPTNTPTATPTPNLAATATAEAHLQETAIAATLTARLAAPTPPTTTSIEDTISTAVAATLAALWTDTPTQISTHTPTATLILTRVPSATPTKIPTATWTPTRTPSLTPRSTSTRTRTPTAIIDADPTVYDNFNNLANDGSFHLRRWGYQTHDPDGEIYQQQGRLVLTQRGQKGQWRGQVLYSKQYQQYALKSPYFFEARLKLESPKQNGSSVTIGVPLMNYAFLQCEIRAGGPLASCALLDLNYSGDFIPIVAKPVSLEVWHSIRLEIEPTSKVVTVYLDGEQIIAYILPKPTNPAKSFLSNVTIDVLTVGIWTPPEETETVKGYIDDVRFGPMLAGDATSQRSSTLTTTPIWTPTRAPTRTPTPPPCKPEVLYCEDFEDGRATGWHLTDGSGQPSLGWKVIRDGTNYVFNGEGHQWATLDNHSWGDYRVQFQLKLLREEAIHLNYRVATSGTWGRYFLGFAPDGITLSKQIDSSFTDLAYESASYQSGQWYEVEIVGWGAHLQIYVDGKLELDFTDQKPLLRGTIAFETLYNSAAQIDDIEVLPAGSEGTSSQTLALGLTSELIIDTDNLNVRDGPGSSYKVLGVANSGERYTITGRNSNSTWWQIDFSGRSGWVSGGYVRLLNPDADVPITSSITQPLTATPAPPSASGQRGSYCSVFWYGSNHSYLAVQEAVTWDIAKSRAEQIGGYLATIGSWEENEFVYALVRDNDAFWSMDQEHGNGLGPWLGGYQVDGSQEPNGGWKWVKTNESFGYQNWANGEPNNSLVNEKFVGFFGYLEAKSSKWNDYPPDNVLNGYIVEFDSDSTICIDTIR